MSRFLLCLILSFPALHAQTAGDWIHSRGNEAMTGLSATELRFPLELAWQHQMTSQLLNGFQPPGGGTDRHHMVGQVLVLSGFLLVD